MEIDWGAAGKLAGWMRYQLEPDDRFTRKSGRLDHVRAARVTPIAIAPDWTDAKRRCISIRPRVSNFETQQQHEISDKRQGGY